MDGELPGNFCRTLTDMEYLSVLPTSVEIMSELNDPGRSARQIGVHSRSGIAQAEARHIAVAPLRRSQHDGRCGRSARCSVK